MLSTSFQERESNSLEAKIKDAELELLECQRTVLVHAETFIQKTQQQITAPTSLLLAGGVGFIIGELTKSKSYKNQKTIEELQETKSPNFTQTLINAMNQLSTINTVYTSFRNSMNQRDT